MENLSLSFQNGNLDPQTADFFAIHVYETPKKSGTCAAG
jgi:hypothetical protein